MQCNSRPIPAGKSLPCLNDRKQLPTAVEWAAATANMALDSGREARNRVGETLSLLPLGSPAFRTLAPAIARLNDLFEYADRISRDYLRLIEDF